MTQFEWLSLTSDPPARWDLRYLGWTMTGALDDAIKAGAPATLDDEALGKPIIVDWRPSSRVDDWNGIPEKRWAMAVGVDDSSERAALIKQGMGDALPTNVALVEVATRALRLGANAQALERFRNAGPVILDLFHRDGRIGEQWLGLHPREFALVWRLADVPGQRVTRRELLTDVWRLKHDPETNSVEVHISRLRSKLSISNADWLIETAPDGGYRLATEHPSGQQALDSANSIGNGGIE